MTPIAGYVRVVPTTANPTAEIAVAVRQLWKCDPGLVPEVAQDRFRRAQPGRPAHELGYPERCDRGIDAEHGGPAIGERAGSHTVCAVAVLALGVTLKVTLDVGSVELQCAIHAALLVHHSDDMATVGTRIGVNVASQIEQRDVI